jgi:SAM-dependent methyltransferase
MSFFRNAARRLLRGSDPHARQRSSSQELFARYGTVNRGSVPPRSSSEHEILRRLFDAEGSDKGWHANAYDIVLRPHRERIGSLLEIGIGTLIPDAPSSMANYSAHTYRPGGSLRGWRNYFPRAEIVGVDVQPDTQFTDERIRTMICNSTDGAAVARCFDANAQFDIVIDDGSHEADDQIATLRNFWRMVRPGGFYFVEDVLHDGALFWNPALIEPFVDGAPYFSVNIDNGQDQWRLIVIRKGD